ncbi:MAG: DJ-1/PfpI family protein [Asgard group archaeon]|nr:DJ-1/PfpI family protein [Asgard group archaeon]
MSLNSSISRGKKNKILITVFVLFLLSTLTSSNMMVNINGQESIDNPYRILFIMDDGYGGNCRYILQIFNDFGFDVTTAAYNKTIIGCSYVGFAEYEVNNTLSDLENIFLYDCISILPGNSHVNLLDNAEFHSLIQRAVSSGIIVTAWCRAVRILARADVINGRNVTGHADYQSEYEAAGATFHLLSPPIVDENVITSVRSQFYRQDTCDLIKATVEDNKPAFIDFSSFLGGTGDEEGTCASLHYLGDTIVDSKGNIIVVGRTTSTDFPVFNAFQENNNGGLDIVISKFHPNGSLIFCTYFGGDYHEWATSVAVDSEDNIVFAGITGSEDFPLQDPLQTENMGGAEGNADCFVTKMAEDGQSLIFSTYLGGTGSDWCYEMNVDASDRIAITGTTYSGNFPTENPHQSTLVGSLDAFLTFIEADGQSLLFSTYLGTIGFDHGRGIAFDSSENILLTGQMGVGNLATTGAFQASHGGGATDAYIASFSTDGTLNYFSFLGGAGFERANDISIDSNDNIVISGYTMSDDFPILEAYQNERAGSYEIFVTKIDTSGMNITFSTYLGGTNIDISEAHTIDNESNIIITGKTKSSDLPITHNPNRTYELTNYDVLLVKLKEDGSSILFSTTFGGEEDDIGIGIAWYTNHSYIISGFTKSDDYPIHHAVQGEFGGVCDMFVMKIQTEDIIITPSSEIGIAFAIAGSGIVLIISTIFVHKKRKR